MKLSLFAAAVIAGSSMTIADAQLSTHQKQPTSKRPMHKPFSIAPAGQPGTSAMVAAGGSDDCSSPKSISGVGTYAFDTTAASTGAEGQGNASCLFFATTGIDSDVWFVWNAPFTGAVEVSLCAGASYDAKLAAYDGAGCPTNAAIGCDDDFCFFAGPSRVAFACTAGNDYTFQIGSYPTAAGGNGTFSITQFFPPTNDDCNGAIAVGGAGPHNFDNSSATTGTQGQNNPNCLSFGTTGISDDVWFTWQAGFTGNAQVNLCAGTSHDAKVAVYDGAGCPAGQALGCDDDFCSFAGPSRATFAVVAGNTYTIQIGNYPTAPGGAGSFTVDPYFPPAGDECTSPTAISGPGPHSFDTTGMTTSAQGQNNPNCQFAFGGLGIFDDEWFSWQSDCTGPVTISLCNGATHDSKIAAYDGGACPANFALDCDDDTCLFAGPSEITINAVAGNTYLIQIGNYATGAGGAGLFDIVCAGGGPPGTPFCLGDGSLATACPCGNFGAAGNGCENSAGTGGANLDATGSTGPDAVVFTSTGELPSALTIFLQGNSPLGNGVVFGDGVRCVGGNLKRLYVKNAIGGTATAPAPGDPSVTTQSAALGDPIAPGSTRWYQAYYRDPNLGFCASPPGNSWNVSSGYQITWP